MDNKSMAEWLRNIADHLEELSPLIRNIEMENDSSPEGNAVTHIHVTFNYPSRAQRQE